MAAIGLTTSSVDDATAHDDETAAIVNLGGTLNQAFWQFLAARGTGPSVPTLNGPGIGLVANKAFLPFSGDLIRFYLDEDPMLSPPSTSLVDQRAPLREGVLKRTDGCEGSDVFFVNTTDGTDPSTNLAELVASWGQAGAIIQDFVEPSRLPVGGPSSWCWFRVELRPITYVIDAGAAIVGEVPVGRASLNLGDRRGNVVRGAHALAVLREPSSTNPEIEAQK